ncbi:MAG: amidophosphoribosyltransferase [Candidatus Shapirobacteria bacterium]|jgi:amidophosphoribosyltransferase
MRKAVGYYLVKGMSLEKAVEKSYPLFTGVFSCLLMTADKIVAIRDRHGVRPLSIGTLEDGSTVFSSETCGLNIIGAKWKRDVLPGEMVSVDHHGLESQQLVSGKEMIDVFEFVYFSRPDSNIAGKNVNQVRKNLGRQLAHEVSVKADLVIPIPDSAIPAAIGFSEISKIPFDMGIIKNRYIHRTFIRPAQNIREGDIKIKLNPLSSIISGKKIALMDDSIVRGTTSREIVSLLRQAGATEVHFLVSSPPVKYPDFYGIDTPRQDQLIAAVKNIKETKEYIRADSLNYLSYKGMLKAVGLPENHLCTSCFSGQYPISIGSRLNDIKII